MPITATLISLAIMAFPGFTVKMYLLIKNRSAQSQTVREFLYWSTGIFLVVIGIIVLCFIAAIVDIYILKNG